jgi:SSS family solute:Na+ symporter
VLAAIIIIPAKLGGYAHVFSAASTALAQKKPPASIILQPSQYLSYATLAFGSAIAIVLYPHTATGVLSSASGRVIKRNAALLPAYNLLLALIALLGFVALAAGIRTANSSSAVPLLFMQMFPEWFSGFCLAAIGIGALVPAAIMSIASANLFTRNLYGELVHRSMTPKQEATQAKLVSLFIKIGALIFVLCVRAQYAIELQLLGGIWIAQLFPSVVCGLFTRWFHGRALLWGWLAGMTTGTSMAFARDLKSSIYPLHFGRHIWTVYAAIPALFANLLVSIAVTLLLNRLGHERGRDATLETDYEAESA